MTTANNLIKISGLTYIMFSLFIIPYIPLFAGILLVIGIILLANCFISLEELNEKKALLIIVAILSIFLNLLAAILIFISLSEISSAKKNSINSPPKEIISSESKKIDLLLKIGLAMVLIAGILFATTTWEFITDPIKIIALIIMGILFLGLSIFAENVLKIEKTTKAYFTLGLAFLVLTFIGVGYFAPFGTWFSFSGAGCNLIYGITFFLTAASFYLINYKFKDQDCLYLAHSSCYLGIFFLLTFFNIPLMGTLLVMTALTLLLNIFTKEEKTSLQKLNAVVTFLYYPLIITQSFSSEFLLLLPTTIINIIDMLIQATKKNSTTESIFTAILSYILIFITLGNVPYNIDALMTIFITMTIYYSVIKTTPLAKNKALALTSQIIYHLASLIIIIYYLFTPSIESIIVTFVYLVLNILGSLHLTKENNEVDFYYQPIVIFYFITSLISYIYKNYFELNLILIPVICSLIYALIDCFSKNKKVKNYYLLFTIAFATFAFICNILTLSIIASIVLLLLNIYIYLRTNKAYKVWVYIFILLNIQELSVALLPNIYANILSLLIFGLLTLVIRNKRLSVVNYLSFTVPLLGLISNLDYAYMPYKIISINFLELYVVFLITKYLIKSHSVKDIVGTALYSIFTLRLLFTGYLEYGIYIGILALLIIFAVFNDDDYKLLFYASIIILIINIIVQLRDFWGMIPFWLYLLIVGLSIIIFVTYKELNKDKQPTLKQKPVVVPQPVELPISSIESSTHQESNTIKEPVREKDQIILAEPIEKISVKEKNTIKEEKAIKENTKDHHQEETSEIKDSSSSKFCSRCGTKNLQESKFCRSCGHTFTSTKTTVSVSKFCPLCGTSNTSNGNFCKTCGHNLVIKK